GVVLALALAALHYAWQPPVYQSNAQVLVIKKNQDVISLPGMEAQRLAYDDYVSAHAVLIQSPLIVGRAVQEKKLENLKSLQGQGEPTSAIIHALKVTRENDGTYNLNS